MANIVDYILGTKKTTLTPEGPVTEKTRPSFKDVFKLPDIDFPEIKLPNIGEVLGLNTEAAPAPTPAPNIDELFAQKGFFLDDDGIYRKKEDLGRTDTIFDKEKEDPLAGFNIAERAAPSDDVKNLIGEAARKHGVSSSLLAAILWQESGFEPNAKNENATGSVDRGIAQINNIAHPNVTDEQAYDPAFAIDYAASILKSNLDQFEGNAPNAALAYNLGVRGVREGRDDVNNYIFGVSQNLTPEARKELGFEI